MAAELRSALRGYLLLIRSLDAGSPLTTAHSTLLELILEDPQRVSALARRLGIRVPSVTEQVIRLERNGLVHRAPDPTDSRAVLVAITPRGRKIFEEDAAVRNETVSQLIQQLSDADREALGRSVGALVRLTEELA
jgi:DNA-binding MarR family transcriptional regulator